MVPKQLIWSDFPFLVECDSSAESGAGSGGGQRKEGEGQKGPPSIGTGATFHGREIPTCHVSSPSLSCFFSKWFSLLEERAGIGALHPGCKIHGCLVLQN